MKRRCNDDPFRTPGLNPTYSLSFTLSKLLLFYFVLPTCFQSMLFVEVRIINALLGALVVVIVG